MTTSILRVIAPIAVLAGSAAIGYYLIRTAPEPVRRPPSSVVPVVEVLAVKTDDYTVNVRSWGTVTPLTQSTLVSEAAGRIVYVAPNFRNGSFFSADEVLARIDPAEYRLTVVNIEATLQGVEARLAELKVTEGNLKKSLVIETQHLELADKQYRRHTALQRQGTLAQSALEQSEREYLLRRATRQTLNNSLGLIPAQRRALEADLRLKQAQLDSARLDLDRTEIRAPYSGRVLEKGVDLGQSVSKGSVLAGIYAVDFMEVRLPVTDHQAVFLDLPETYADGSTTGGYLPVKLFAVGGKRHAWQGRVVRTEGAIDARTRQLFVIAQVDNPYSRHSNGRPPLKVGKFVEAEIRGRLLKDVFVLPRKAVRADDEVLLVTQEDRIQRRGVEVIWRAQDNLIVRGGLEQGDRISLTSLPYAPDGSRVAVAGRTSQAEAGNGERRPVQSAGKDQTAGTVEQGRRPESEGEI